MATTDAAMTTTLDEERRPLLPRHEDDERSQQPTADNNDDDEAGAEEEASGDNRETMAWARRNQWVVLAIASGACAAFNGVFAKLTTTELTTTISKSIANFLNLSHIEGACEFVIRAIFFGLNLIFNGVMWTLFTQALAKGHSTTQVSIMNTSSNFVITALLGLAIFSESLPPLWWLGAALLVAGNVIIGRKDEKPAAAAAAAAADDYAPLPQQPGLVAPAAAGMDGEEDKEDSEDEDVVDLGDLNASEHRA